ncbi:MAG: hypothetical protein IT353_00430 [Gemmatimonadaceae bacterium]|nr:hypothetical protein [Gemmatimonadaceae bacterium]
MFATCLTCHSSLGANDVIETFPVGRRLAFDQHTGRLWVVCTSCGHWNLSPLEERWEAIEACERLYRSARIRASTDNIGITSLREGLHLIRIGKPLRPEFSAWRFGPRLVARRRKAALVAVGSVAVTAAASVAVVGASLGALAVVLFSGSVGGLALAGAGLEVFEKLHDHREYEREIGHVRGMNGHRYTLRQKHLRLISLEPGGGVDGWHLSLQHERGVVNLTCVQATLTAGQLLARLNAKGASKATVQQAAHRIADAGDAQQFIRNAIALRDARRRKGLLLGASTFDSFGLLPEERLAVEMAMHEDAERQALEGELQALVQAWKDAEEIGAIADRMFVR